MKSILHTTNRIVIKSLFDKFDEDRSGNIETSELGNLLSDMGLDQVCVCVLYIYSVMMNVHFLTTTTTTTTMLVHPTLTRP